MATEVEIKLAFEKNLASTQLDELVSVLKGLDCDAQYQQKTLKNAYFDTPDFSLNLHKVALRIRQILNDKDAPVFIQTFKTAGTSIDGLSQRGEWEWPLSNNKLSIEKLFACKSWPMSINAHDLVTVFETNFTRYIFEVTRGMSEIELVLDIGHILSNAKQEKIHEIELELKKGQQEDLKALAAVLIESMPLVPSDKSKAERGVNLFKALA